MENMRTLRLLRLSSSKESNQKSIPDAYVTLPRGEQLLARSVVPVDDIAKLVINRQVSASDFFTMEVTDNRMADAGIKKGDYAVVERLDNICEGDVVAVRLGERNFIRRYFTSARRIRLECTTPAPQSMIIDSETPGFKLLGCVRQVIKPI